MARLRTTVTRRLTVAWLGLAAVAGIQCRDAERVRTGSDQTLTIHMPDRDERVLGPMGAYPWFFVFLGIAQGLDVDDAVPELLDRWEHSPDYSEWTLHIREGVVWGDGTPVTAEDVKFSLELWTSPDVGYDSRFFEGITVLDAHTLHVVFTEPVASTIFVYTWLPIVPKHLLDTLDISEFFRWPFWVQPVGNGPYRYVRHIAGVMTELEANPDYYGDPPRTSKLVLRYGGNGLTELLSGNVDIATGLTPVEAVQLGEDPRFQVAHDVNNNTRQAIAWNHRNPLFRDAVTRRALTMAIDRRALLRALYYPDDIPIVDVPVRLRHVEGDIVPDPLPFAPDRARALLAETGWVDANGDGVLERDGQEFRFTLSVRDNESTQAVFIQDQLRRVGVRMDIATYDQSLWRQRARSGDFDATIWLADYINNFRTFPITGYRNAEISALRDSAWYTLDPDTHDRHMRDLWRLVAEEVPITYLHPLVRYRVAHRRVKGFQDMTDFVRDIEDLWIGDK